MHSDYPDFEPISTSADDEARWEAYRALMRRTGAIQSMPGLDDADEDGDADKADDWRWLPEESGQPDPSSTLDLNDAVRGPPMPKPLSAVEELVAWAAAVPTVAIPPAAPPRTDRRSPVGWGRRLVEAAVVLTAGVAIGVGLDARQHQPSAVAKASPTAASSLRVQERPVEIAPIATAPELSGAPSASADGAPTLIPLAGSNTAAQPVGLRSVHRQHCPHCQRARVQRSNHHLRRHSATHARRYTVAPWWGH
jgi:hypothetical protein